MVVKRKAPRDNRKLNMTWYTKAFYHVMANDKIRNAAYERAVKKLKGRTVVEIGTGPFALLSKMALDAGATRVYAIEENPISFQNAKSRYKNEKKIRFVKGFSLDVELPEKCDTILHEIIGGICSEEGVALVVNDAKERFLNQSCKRKHIFIPSGCTTFFSPAGPLYDHLSFKDIAVSMMFGGGSDESVGVYDVYNFPQDNILSDSPAVFEQINFHEDFSLRQKRNGKFVISKNGYFDGFVFWFKLEIDPENILNSLHQKMNWAVVYIKIGKDPFYVKTGDSIKVRSEIELGSTMPKYSLDVTIYSNRGECIKELKYTWEGA
jgi:hypothetical protein